MKPILLASLVFFAMIASSVAQIPAGQRVGLARYLAAGYMGLKAHLLTAAEQMPESSYGYKPGTMPEVRTYGQIFAHVAAGQFGTCAVLKGVPNPVQARDLEMELKTKAEFVKTLADSFTFCDDAVAGLTDANAADLVRQGQGEVARAAVIAGLIAHNAEMYGISTVYLRANNLVPPSTEQQNQRRAPAK